MKKNKKDEIRLLVENWRDIISEENIMLEDVLKMLLEENKYLNEAVGGKKVALIASLLTSLFIMSPKVTNANPTKYQQTSSSVEQQICDGGGSGECSVEIKPMSALSKIQMGIRSIGIDLDISEIDGMSEDDAISFIKDKINKNISSVEDALKSEQSIILSGIEDDVSNMNIRQLVEAYRKSPMGVMFEPIISLIDL